MESTRKAVIHVSVHVKMLNGWSLNWRVYCKGEFTQLIWGVPSSGIYCRVVSWKSARVSEEHRLHLQGWISRAKYQRESRLQACRLTFNGLRGVISQKIETLHNHGCENLKSYNLYEVWSSHGGECWVRFSGMWRHVIW